MELVEVIFTLLAVVLIGMMLLGIRAVHSKVDGFGSLSSAAPNNTRESTDKVSPHDLMRSKSDVDGLYREIDLRDGSGNEQDLNLETLSRRLDEVGIACKRLKDSRDRDSLVFRISRLRSWRAIVFQATIDQLKNVELISSPQDVTLDRDALKADLLKEMLQLNSTNKSGLDWFTAITASGLPRMGG